MIIQIIYIHMYIVICSTSLQLFTSNYKEPKTCLHNMSFESMRYSHKEVCTILQKTAQIESSRPLESSGSAEVGSSAQWTCYWGGPQPIFPQRSSRPASNDWRGGMIMKKKWIMARPTNCHKNFITIVIRGGKRMGKTLSKKWGCLTWSASWAPKERKWAESGAREEDERPCQPPR
jgi:hypothetical protein